MLCEICQKREKTRVKWCKYVCDLCEPEPLFNGIAMSGVRTLLKGQSGEIKISEAEANEIKRNVAIPMGNGRYKAGRMGENGKIQERPISA